MKKRRMRRGVSAGTIVTLTLTAALIFVSCFVYARLTGENGAISIDPQLINGSITELINDLRSDATRAPEETPTQAARVRQESDEALVFAAVQATEAPTIYMPSVVTIHATGQVMMGNELRTSGRQENGMYDFSDIFASVSDALGGANLSIATLRGTLDDGSSGSFGDYRAPDALAIALKGAGVNLMNLGTDRTLDYGVSGVTATRSVLRQRNLSAAGAYTSQEEADARNVVEIGGVKVGVVSYTTSVSAAGQKATTEDERCYAVRQYDLQTATQDIAALREAGAEAVIVLINWGKRGDTEPSKTTIEQANALARAGADVILGTGPTNVHRMEKILTDDGREVFVAYSLGNFLTDDSRETNDITGVVLHLELEWNSQTQALSLREAWYMPTWIMRWREDGTAKYRIVPAGSSTVPENMTDSIYVNMKKSYQALTDKLGTEVAMPRAE